MSDEILKLTDRARGASCLIGINTSVKFEKITIVVWPDSEAMSASVLRIQASLIVVQLKHKLRSEGHIYIVVFQLQPCNCIN